MKTPRRNPIKSLVGIAFAYSLMALAALFIVVAAFIWLAKAYGTETALASTGGVLFLTGAIMLFWLRAPKVRPSTMHPKLASDPLAKHIPQNLRENPTMQKLLNEIAENPVMATAMAVTVGMLLSKEILED